LLAPKSEKIIRVELSDVQLDYYKNILTRNYAALNEGAKGQKQSLLEHHDGTEKGQQSSLYVPERRGEDIERK